MSQILPLDEMPTDDYGFVADCCIDPHAVVNRMNVSQMYEVGINRISVFVQRQAMELLKTQGEQAAIDHILGYIRKINPQYVDIIVEPRVKANPKSFLDTIAKATAKNEVGIFIMIPPFLKQITPELILQLEKDYDVKSSPATITYATTDEKRHKVRTKFDVSIGAKYLFMLYKLSRGKAPGVGYINQHFIAVKPQQNQKHKSLIGQTPLRIGEDENRIFNMCAGPEPVVRLMGIHANSFTAVKKTANTLLRVKHPELIERIDISTDEIIASSEIIGVAKHMAATIGINLDNIDCESSNGVIIDEAKLTADINAHYPGQL